MQLERRHAPHFSVGSRVGGGRIQQRTVPSTPPVYAMSPVGERTSERTADLNTTSAWMLLTKKKSLRVKSLTDVHGMYALVPSPLLRQHSCRRLLLTNSTTSSCRLPMLCTPTTRPEQTDDTQSAKHFRTGWNCMHRTASKWLRSV